jgi:hypothetical protein
MQSSLSAKNQFNTVARHTQDFADEAKAIVLTEGGRAVDTLLVTRCRNSLGDIAGQQDNYIWLRKEPSIYLGKADHKNRLLQYVNSDGTFGPSGEYVMYAVMLNFQRRGFAISVRYRITTDDAVGEETRSMESFSFALADKKNGGHLRVALPSEKCITTDYPVKRGKFSKNVTKMFVAARRYEIGNNTSRLNELDLDE